MRAAGDRSGTLSALARFHQRFVRLHPFKAANQSLCMNVVGYVLGLSHGAGMPHTILDHFALRLSEPAYERVFATAAEVGIVTGSAAERWRLLAERKRRAFDFIAKIERGADPNGGAPGGPRGRPVRARRTRYLSGWTTISTRRLLARPSAVALSATGRLEPRPTALILSAGMPRLTRCDRTVSARCWLKASFFVALPCESVWPSTTIDLKL